MKIIGYVVFPLICFCGWWNVLIQFASFPLSFIEGRVRRMFVPLEFRRPIIGTTSIIITAWLSWIGIIYLWHIVFGGVMPILAIIFGFVGDALWISFHKKTLTKLSRIEVGASCFGSFVFIITWIIFVPRPLIWF